MNDNRLLTGLCRGIESPWWRTDSNWKCQGVSLLGKLWFPPWISWHIYDVYCLELDRWLLQCFLLQDPRWTRHHFTVMVIFYYFSYLLFILSFVIPPSITFIRLCGNISSVPIFNAKLLCLPAFCQKRWGKNQLSPYNLSWNQLSALTPPPERFGQLPKRIKVNLYLQIGWPLASWRGITHA